MTCRLDDFTISARTRVDFDGHKVEYAPAVTHDLRLAGWVYWLDGVFKGFTGMDARPIEAREAVLYHVRRELEAEPSILHLIARETQQ